MWEEAQTKGFEPYSFCHILEYLEGRERNQRAFEGKESSIEAMKSKWMNLFFFGEMLPFLRVL